MKRFLILFIGVAVVLRAFILSGNIFSYHTSISDREFRLVYSGEITTLNYLTTATANEFSLLANFVDPLVEYDRFGKIQPALAEEWTVSEDGLIWTFKLRQGVKWVNHEGKVYSPVTAQDFVDGLKYVLTSDNNSKTANIVYSMIKNAKEYYEKEIRDFNQVGVKALDKYTLQYTLIKPIPYFLSTLTYTCFFPVNGQFLKDVGDKFGTDNRYILYNGPYIMPTYEAHHRRILEKNKYYWDKDKVHIDKIIMTYNKEAGVLAPEMFLRGEIDHVNIGPDLIHEWIKDEKKKDLIRPNRTNFFSYFYAFNFNPNFPEEYDPDNWEIAVNNKNFRKSIFHALDRRSALLTEEPYEPESRLLNTITPKGFLSIGEVDYTELEALKKFSREDSFNVKLALAYKEKAMEELRGEVSFPVKVLMPYNTASRQWANRAQVIKYQLERVLGRDYIDVIIEAKSPTGFFDKVRNSGNYGLMELNWGADFADPETYTHPFKRDSTFSWIYLAKAYEGEGGYTIYENLLEKAIAEVTDVSKRYSLFAAAEAFLIEEAFVIPYAVGGGGYSASRINPFEISYSPFGATSGRYKGLKLLKRPMNIDQYKRELYRWQMERKGQFERGRE
ncbi:MAG: peptide ABC transporter substrate-binding protein [Tissierellia bacterium]|nr:peptide ABC transporter substrate-binding protein [Tissierellia bacterium]